MARISDSEIERLLKEECRGADRRGQRLRRITYTAFMAAKARALVLSLAALCLPAFANIPRTALVAGKPHRGRAVCAGLASGSGYR
jgi:hypothetical protein